MSKEKFNQIIDEAYDRFLNETIKIEPTEVKERAITQLLNSKESKDEFINKCKTDLDFSQKWGIQIEERELTPKERIELAGGKIQDKYPALVEMSLRVCDERDIPTKLTTITYKNETVINYE